MDGVQKTQAAGRPRSDQAREAILRAGLDLAAQDGYQAVTILGIAAEAGVGRQTIYRWWPTKAAVLLEAITEFTLPEVSPPPTGIAEHDLRAVLRASFVLAPVVGSVITGLMAESTHDSEFAAALQEQLLAPRRALVRKILADGQATGQVGHGIELDLAVDLAWGTMWYRTLSKHAPVDEALADELTEAIMRLAGPGSGTQAPV